MFLKSGSTQMNNLGIPSIGFNFYKGICAQSYVGELWWIEKQTQRSILYALCIVYRCVCFADAFIFCLNHSMYFDKEIIYLICCNLNDTTRNKQETLGIYHVNFWNMPKYSEIKVNSKGVSFPICKLKHSQDICLWPMKARNKRDILMHHWLNNPYASYHEAFEKKQWK